MKLFYVTSKNRNSEDRYILTEELSSDYDSRCIDINIAFYQQDLSDPTVKIALFTDEEVAILKRMESKEISYQEATQLRLKGEAVSRFDRRMFEYYTEIQYIEVEFKI